MFALILIEGLLFPVLGRAPGGGGELSPGVPLLRVDLISARFGATGLLGAQGGGKVFRGIFCYKLRLS